MAKKLQLITTTYTPESAQARLNQLAPDGQFLPTVSKTVSAMAYYCHLVAVSRYWWHEKDGTPKERNFGELLALVHSEVSEGLEGGRKGLDSDHIHRKLTDDLLEFTHTQPYSMLAEEMADVFIRMGDLMFALCEPLEQAIFDKLEFNMIREDHNLSARETADGKGF